MTLTQAYTVLGVQPTHTRDHIKKVFRDKAKRHHPDMGGDAQKFRLLKEAYDIIIEALDKADRTAKQPDFDDILKTANNRARQSYTSTQHQSRPQTAQADYADQQYRKAYASAFEKMMQDRIKENMRKATEKAEKEMYDMRVNHITTYVRLVISIMLIIATLIEYDDSDFLKNYLIIFGLYGLLYLSSKSIAKTCMHLKSISWWHIPLIVIIGIAMMIVGGNKKK